MNEEIKQKIETLRKDRGYTHLRGKENFTVCKIEITNETKVTECNLQFDCPDCLEAWLND
jgi:pimeloyl-CoA synthetase